jgi:hypothetical protein
VPPSAVPRDFEVLQSDWRNGKWEKAGDICKKFGVVNSTIQKIWKNNTKIISKFERMDQEYGHCFKAEFSDVDEALLKWFKQERSDNVPVNSPLPRITSVLSNFNFKLM